MTRAEVHPRDHCVAEGQVMLFSPWGPTRTRAGHRFVPLRPPADNGGEGSPREMQGPHTDSSALHSLLPRPSHTVHRTPAPVHGSCGRTHLAKGPRGPLGTSPFAVPGPGWIPGAQSPCWLVPRVPPTQAWCRAPTKPRGTQRRGSALRVGAVCLRFEPSIQWGRGWRLVLRPRSLQIRAMQKLLEPKHVSM